MIRLELKCLKKTDFTFKKSVFSFQTRKLGFPMEKLKNKNF